MTRNFPSSLQEPAACWGEPLDSLFDAPLERRLRVSVALASALGRVHQRGLVQGKLDPAQVLVNLATDQVWLPPPALPADALGDLASLGAVLDELFQGNVCSPVLAIVGKLRAVDAEDGYQTAAGVESDLRRCLAMLQSLGRIERFRLGAHDCPLAAGRGQVIYASCDWYKAGIPHAVLADAFQILLHRALRGCEAEVARSRQAILAAVGQDGQLIVELIPTLEFLIGQKPRPRRLPPVEARQRFAAVFGAFAAAFACPERPMLIVLEDAQWLDAASAAFLEGFTSPSLRFALSVSGPW
jgi:hypothetical protein